MKIKLYDLKLGVETICDAEERNQFRVVVVSAEGRDLGGYRWHRLIPFLKRFKILSIEEGYNTREEVEEWKKNNDYFGFCVEYENNPRVEVLTYYSKDNNTPNKVFRIK